MPTQLVRACVLLAVASGATPAADPPKGKPTTGAVVGPLLGPDLAPRADTKFVVTKPVGTWVREAEAGDAKCKLELTLADDRLTLKFENKHGSAYLVGDYAINKESRLFGVIDSFDITPDSDKSTSKCVGQPFCVRFRVDGTELTIKEFKGLGVGMGEPPSKDVAQVLSVICGRYGESQGTFELDSRQIGDPPPTPMPKAWQKSGPPPQRIHGGIMKADPPKRTPAEESALLREDQLRNQSEDLRAIGETWRRFWETQITSDRIRNGIMGAPAPKAEEKDFTHDKDSTAAILPPLKKGEQPKCDPPTDAEVLLVFAERPGMKGVAAAEVLILKKLAKESLDDPRFYPLVGIAQLHRCQWECSVYHSEGKRVKVETISLDQDKLYLYPSEDWDRQQQLLLEMTKWR